MKRCFIFILIALSSISIAQKPLVFTVQMEPAMNVQELRVYLNWKSITSRNNELVKEHLSIIDLNNNKIIIPAIIDTDRNGIPEGIYFATPFDRSESIRTFALKQNKSISNKIDNLVPVNYKVLVTYLTDAKSYMVSHGDIKSWTEIIANTFLNIYPNPADLEIFSKGKWGYTNGFFLNALSIYYETTKNSAYLNYIKHWVNLFINENGEFDTLKFKRANYELDNILPGRLLLFLHQQTGDQKYAKAAEMLIDQLNNQPRTIEGGFWHKKIYPNQMWLDGIYMADVYLAQYAAAFNQPKYFDEAVKQMELIYTHTLDTKTGLLYHGWDESKNKVWADPKSGASPEFWGRALGWYIMALVDGLDYFPVDHPERNKLLQIFKNLSSALAKYQDTTSGLWYQVVDKGYMPGNWFESSGSAMFAYAFAKGVQKGYLGSEFRPKALKAFNGLVDHEVYFDDQGKIYLNGTVKVGTLNLKVSKGNYEYYIGVDRRINDFKGVAAFFYLALVLGK